MPKAISITVFGGSYPNIRECIHVENENSQDYKLMFGKGKADEFVEKVIQRELIKNNIRWPMVFIEWCGVQHTLSEIKGNKSKSFAEMFGFDLTKQAEVIGVFVFSTKTPLSVLFRIKGDVLFKFDSCIHIENENSDDYKLIFSKGKAGDFVEKVLQRELNKITTRHSIDSISWDNKEHTIIELENNREKSFMDIFNSAWRKEMTVFISEVSMINDIGERKKKAEEILGIKGYKNPQFLGNGAFGVTYKCENKEGKLVAVKVIFGLFGEEDIEKELKEAKEINSMRPMNPSKYEPLLKLGLITQEEYDEKKQKYEDFEKFLNKPQIIPVTDREKKQYAILELPLADGDLTNTNNKKSFGDIRKIAINVLKALDIMHAHDRLHLDIKPDNILEIKGDGGQEIYQVADFGTVQAAVDKNCVKKINGKYKIYYGTGSASFGDIRYKAPETQTGNYLTDIKGLKSVDIYAVGVSLCILSLRAMGRKVDANDVNLVNAGLNQLRTTAVWNTPDKDMNKVLTAIGKMCSLDPKKRPTAKEAIKMLT